MCGARSATRLVREVSQRAPPGKNEPGLRASRLPPANLLRPFRARMRQVC
jgi:hypothetical protein